MRLSRCLCAWLVMVLLAGCVARTVDHRGRPHAKGAEDGSPTDPIEVDQPNPGGNESVPAPEETSTNTPPAPVPTTPAPQPAQPAFKDVEAAAVAVCQNASGSESRRKALDYLNAYKVGARTMTAAALGKDQDACVITLLPTAIFVNLKSGIPVGTLLGQAIQETGWCKSTLVPAFNFHGMKASLPKANFDYWDGAFVAKSSSESTTGSGNNQVSNFMKFKHPDHGFYAVAERLHIKSLPYRDCVGKKDQTEAYMECIGKTWAVHGTYAKVVLGHRANFRSTKYPNLRLASCELKKDEWRLASKFAN